MVGFPLPGYITAGRPKSKNLENRLHWGPAKIERAIVDERLRREMAQQKADQIWAKELDAEAYMTQAGKWVKAEKLYAAKESKARTALKSKAMR